MAVVVLLLAGSAVALFSNDTRSEGSAICIDVGHGLPQLADLDSLLGTHISCLMTFANETRTWSEWADPWFLHTSERAARYGAWARAGHGTRKIILTISMVPSSAPSNWREKGAAGAYDKFARQLARTLVASGLGGAVIRLDPESNLGVSPMGIGPNRASHEAWRSYWARIARVMKSTPGGHFLLDWTVNAAVKPIPFMDYYPGSAAVDIIGIDQYDTLANGQQMADGPQRWAALANEKAGLNQLLAFAHQHHKPVSVPEWGDVGTPVRSGGGDDPYYITQMAKVFAKARVSYESYFDTSIQGTIPLEYAPRSFEAYRRVIVGAG